MLFLSFLVAYATCLACAVDVYVDKVSYEIKAVDVHGDRVLLFSVVHWGIYIMLALERG